MGLAHVEIRDSAGVLRRKFSQSPMLLPNGAEVDFDKTSPTAGDIEHDNLWMPLAFGITFVIRTVAMPKLGILQCHQLLTLQTAPGRFREKSDLQEREAL